MLTIWFPVPQVSQGSKQITRAYVEIFFGISCCEETIHILQESDLCDSHPVSLQVLIQGLVKDCLGVLNPWDSLVHVSCPLYPFTGPCYSKANKDWLLRAKAG